MDTSKHTHTYTELSARTHTHMNSNKYACYHTNTPTHNFTYAELDPRKQTGKKQNKTTHTHIEAHSPSHDSDSHVLLQGLLKRGDAEGGRRRWGLMLEDKRGGGTHKFHSYNKRWRGGVKGGTNERKEKARRRRRQQIGETRER